MHDYYNCIYDCPKEILSTDTILLNKILYSTNIYFIELIYQSKSGNTVCIFMDKWEKFIANIFKENEYIW